MWTAEWLEGGTNWKERTVWQPPPVASAVPECPSRTQGAYVSAGGVRLHYLDRGRGQPVVYIHGTGRMLAGEIEVSDFGRMLAQNYRVIAFDRPGYGRSGRAPVMAGPLAQALYLREAVQRLNIAPPILVGHSWGGAVALAYAVLYPTEIRGVVHVAGWSHLVSGMKLKTLDTVLSPLASLLATGVVPAELLRRLGRIGLARAFAPNPVPQAFLGFSNEYELGAYQLRTNSEDLRVLNRDIAPLQPAYARISNPVEIIVGMADRLVKPSLHGEALARDIPGSRMTRLRGVGHMVQHVSPRSVIDAVGRIAGVR